MSSNRSQFPLTLAFLKKMYASINNNLDLNTIPKEVMYHYTSNIGKTSKVSPYGLTDVDEFWVDIVMKYNSLGAKYRNLIKDIVSTHK